MISPNLAILGNLIVDDIVYPDGRTEMGQPGGAALYAALGAALWCEGVAIVSRVGDDYPADLLEELRDRGIDLSCVSRLPGGSLRTWLLYEGRRRRVVHRLGGPTHAQASPRAADLPASWRCGAIHLAPMPLAVQGDLIDELGGRDGTILSADPYELLREENFASWSATYAACDLLLFSEDELLIDGALEQPLAVLERLCGNGSGRLARVVLKRGSRGGLAYERNVSEPGQPTPWAPRAERVVESTGAGDAFAGGVLAGLLGGDALSRALERGVVSASYALAGPGAEALLGATPVLAGERWAEWFGAGEVDV